jgi:hypothetical protein
MEGDARHALAKFFAQLSYFDIDGPLLHNWEEPPTLIVMLIAPSSTRWSWKRGIRETWHRRDISQEMGGSLANFRIDRSGMIYMRYERRTQISR